MYLSKEERLLRNLERTNLIADRERSKKLEEERKAKEEIERNTISIALNNPQFTQVCKSAFFVTNSPTGRFDISFHSIDILSLCKGEFVSKNVYDKIYKFLVVGISKEDLIEIVKRSPMFSSLVEKL
jgi:hypothetical protein